MYSQSQDDLGVVSFVEAMEPPRVREFEIGSGPEEAASFSEFVLDYIVPHSVLIDDAESPDVAYWAACPWFLRLSCYLCVCLGFTWDVTWGGHIIALGEPRTG